MYIAIAFITCCVGVAFLLYWGLTEFMYYRGFKKGTKDKDSPLLNFFKSNARYLMGTTESVFEKYYYKGYLDGLGG